MTSPTPVAAPVDSRTASLLALIAGDRVHADDQARVEAAIKLTASQHGGLVDPNNLRVLLHNEHGCVVAPGVIGATVHALKRAGVLNFAGWVETTGSRTGNNGRAARAYWCDLGAFDPTP